jgi:hypothetical protein
MLFYSLNEAEGPGKGLVARTLQYHTAMGPGAVRYDPESLASGS